MKRSIVLSITLLCLISLNTLSHPAHNTALDNYIAQPDSTYSYEVVDNKQFDGFSVVRCNMNSVTWLTDKEVNRTIWQHQLITIIPDNLKHKNALMWIGGGSNDSGADKEYDQMLKDIALATQSMVAEIRMIPNQRLIFSDESDPRYQKNGRKEDELIAYGWDKYLATLDPIWLPRLPITKAVVRAMDTVQSEYSDVEGFVVAGASKRGWATWTTAAVDSRVIAIAPLVIDIPNVVINMQHHFDVYGYWSDALHDYEEMGIMNHLHSKEFQKMMKIIDPYFYFNRLTMPKFIVNAASDQFFLPDSSQFYFKALKREKYLRYVPNADHSLNSEATKDFTAFYYSILNKQQRPIYGWRKYADGKIKVTSKTSPLAVRLWQASNPKERNFRLDTIGKTWTSTPLAPRQKGVYIAKVDPPESGWTAFMVELEYETEGPFPLRVTTEISVIPSKNLLTPTVDRTSQQKTL